MTNAIKKTPNDSGLYPYVIGINAEDYSTADWEHDPIVTGVTGISTNYWKYDGTTTVAEMSQAEKDVVDAQLAIDIMGNDENLPCIMSFTVDFAANEMKTIDVVYPMVDAVVHVMDPMFEELVSETLLSASGSGPVGWDPFNVGTNDASINNGSYTDLVYNNTISGNTSGLIMGIDMGKPTLINAMKRWDYSSSYYDTEWQFIGTDDATAATYDVIFSETQNAPFLDPNPYIAVFDDVTYRYYGWRCVTSFNATYTISRELELYNGVKATVEKELAVGTDFDISKINATEFHVTNLKPSAKKFKIVIVGK